MSFIERDWFILCWSAKWLNEKKIYSSSLPKHKSYKSNRESDKELLKPLWELLDEADIVISHNGIKFDRRKVNTRFILNGMTPPSPYRMIDTLVLARREFSFTSNRLNDIGQMLGVGKKKETGGFNLWSDCLDGKMKAWKKMEEYCKQDVRLLERVYLKLRPFHQTHPNLSLEGACGKCGSSNIQNRGFSYANSGKYQRYVCKDCGGWGKYARQKKQCSC